MHTQQVSCFPQKGLYPCEDTVLASNYSFSDGIHTDGINFELQTEVALCVSVADAFNDLLQG